MVIAKPAESKRFELARYSVCTVGDRITKYALTLTGKSTAGVYIVPIYIEFSCDEQHLTVQAARFNAQLKAVGKLHPPPYRERWFT